MTAVQRKVTQAQKKKIFISWSGNNSKEIAKELKKILETLVFANTGLECFFSDQDIASGADWWKKIKMELRSCKFGILCVTKENLEAPWLYYEAGAMISREINCTPLLFNCDINALKVTPLNGNHAVSFADKNKFLKMLKDINEAVKCNLSEEQLSVLGKEAYEKIKKDMGDIFSDLRSLRKFNAQYIYPSRIRNVKLNSIYISLPISSISEDEYKIIKKYIPQIGDALMQIGFTEVFCPAFNINSNDRLDGKAKAIRENFPIMKAVDSMLVIYPWNIATSTLVETGYGIALTKRMVIFHKNGLPYILDEAGSSIGNVRTYGFDSYNDIVSIIESNGMALFEGDIDE